MAKPSKKKIKQRPLQQKQPTSSTGNNVNPASSVKESSQPMTIETVAASATQAEFEKNKAALVKQVGDDISQLKRTKEDVEDAIEKAKEDLGTLKERKESLIQERDKLQEEVNGIQGELDNAKDVIRNAESNAQKAKDDADAYAKETCDNADKYASQIRTQADEERMNTLAKASNEARAAWKTQIDDLSRQIQEIAQRETELHDAKREFQKEQRLLQDEKIELEDLKEELQARKARYDAANPAKITELETELSDERNKYDMLKERYQALTKRLESLQVLMDTVKTEVEDPENGIRVTSMSDIVFALQEYREKYEKLKAVYTQYPDDASISQLEDKARKTELLECENEALQLERNRYREEAVAARNATKELEIVKQEVEATNALNEHLLQELESHKSALESRTGDTCPSLSKVDAETETAAFKKEINERMRKTELKSLSEIVSHVRNYAGSRPDGKQLYYTENDIRAFLAGMAVSRLIILQGMSGTGKSSLPNIFAEAISGFNKLIPVESSWRDRNELLGYYNDFNKKFNAKSFTIELYRSSKERCQQIPTFIVLDEMNLARIEYYFSDFLAILQEVKHEKWLIELVSSDMRTLPMELPESVKSQMKKDDPSVYSIWEKIEKCRQGDLKAKTSDEEEGILFSYLEKLGQLTGAKSLIDGRKIRVTDNIWFVGTANRDESTFEISDKVYDRAQVVSLNRKGVPVGTYTPCSPKFISVNALMDLFQTAIRKNQQTAIVQDRLQALDNILMDKFDTSFGNRIVTQTVDFVAVFVAAGGRLEDALDYQISTKILRKVIGSDDEESLLELQMAVTDYPETTRLIEKRLRELR